MYNLLFRCSLYIILSLFRFNYIALLIKFRCPQLDIKKFVFFLITKEYVLDYYFGPIQDLQQGCVCVFIAIELSVAGYERMVDK